MLLTRLQSHIPPLENGDCLDRVEFERRYTNMPAVKKAELVAGIVYMASPLRFMHAQPHAGIITWLGIYHAATPGTQLGDNATVRLNAVNEPQPDALLFCEGGPCSIDADGYVVGPPEFVAEIAGSSASYDLTTKKDVYVRNGIREYLVWQVETDRIDWWQLQAGVYVPLPVGSDGVIKSRVFPGLWLDCPALERRDLARVLAIGQQGLESPEYRTFCPR